MDMKKLLILGLLLAAQTGYADDAATAFMTGFANALNVRMGGQPYQAPAQVTVNTNVYESKRYDPHWDAVRFDNQQGNFYFFSQSECEQFLKRSAGEYTVCTHVY